MSLFKRNSPPEARAGEFFLAPGQLIPTRPSFTTAGVPITPANALTKVPLLAATNLVADMPAILDAAVFTGHGGERREMRMPVALEDPEGNGFGLVDFAYKYISTRILRGNVFLRVDAVNNDGRPSVVTLLDPADVQAYRDPNTGVIWYIHGTKRVKARAFPRQAVGGIIHRRAFPQPDAILGLSVVANHARLLGLSIAAEQFGADFFGDGAHPSGILTSDMPITEDQARTIKQRFIASIRGSREPAVLGAAVKYTQVQIAPEESQFLDTQKFSAAELCRMVGPGVAEMLGYETGGNLTYQNVEARSLHLLIYTVDKWLKDFERCMSTYFLTGPQSLEFDRNDLLRMTAEDRWGMYQTQLQNAGRTINEVRHDEGLPPVPWGDQPYLPSFGKTGTAAAEQEQIKALEAEGTPIATGGSKLKTPTPGKGKVPAAPKIGGLTSK